MTADLADQRPRVRVHLTNVTGTGAVRLAESLLPALVASRAARVSELYLPQDGPLCRLAEPWSCIDIVRVRRRLPNAVSRFVECVFPNAFANATEPLLVLGDLPLRHNGRQTLFVQTPHLVSSASAQQWPAKFKFAVARFVMKINLGRVDAVVVQTEVMRRAMASAYPAMAPKLHVVGQPVPQWLMPFRSIRTGTTHDLAEGLRLVYPAAAYPHKNHALLGRIPLEESASWPVASLTITLDAARNPAPQLAWLEAAGALEPAAVIDLYRQADALLFLSLEESYGFPLIEAMYVGIPIVCADRPFARVLCGDDAIYFDPHSVESLRSSVDELRRRLTAGWWPDWRERLRQLPPSWQDVADRVLRIAAGPGESAPDAELPN